MVPKLNEHRTNHWVTPDWNSWERHTPTQDGPELLFSDLCAVVPPAVPLTTAYHPTAPSSQRCCHCPRNHTHCSCPAASGNGAPNGSGSTFHAEVLWSDNKQLGALFRLWPLPHLSSLRHLVLQEPCQLASDGRVRLLTCGGQERPKGERSEVGMERQKREKRKQCKRGEEKGIMKSMTVW